MDNINKIISFVLGLIVVAIFLVIISGRLEIGKRFLTASRGDTTSITPTQNEDQNEEKDDEKSGEDSANVSPTEKLLAQNTTVTPTRSVGDVKSIPDTGADMRFAVLIVTAVASGFGMLKMSGS